MASVDDNPQDQDAPPSSGLLPIRRLQEAVINRIAAGEIIHRPSSALKELLENALDAGSTSIKITVKDGGMKLLQIQDNGCGIRKEDLPILAERFTTSKISTFQDLEKLVTYGFRGEALASISYVSHLSVITKTKTDACAWKATYEDGKLISRDGSPAEPKPCAGNNGTTITVENLFYNSHTRLSALRGSSEEYNRILDVVTRYAIHNPHVAFTCKKTGSPSPDVSTPSDKTVKQAIQLIYGSIVSKDLLHVKTSNKGVEECSSVSDGTDDDEPVQWSAEVYFTSPNYQAKKTTFLLFINHRLVDSSRIRKALEGAYTAVLPKGACPFVYLSLQINPKSVDVNVHPTKREVHFLDEEEIAQLVADAVSGALAGESQWREFQYQTTLTGGIAPSQAKAQGKSKGKEKAKEVSSAEQSDEEAGSSTVKTAAKKIYSQHKVRTSQADRTLDSMFVVNETGPQLHRAPDIPESDVYLRSVKGLRQDVLKGVHIELTEIIQKHTFVGIVDLSRCLSLLQYGKSLYLVNHGALAEEFFYQLGLRQFGDFHHIKLEPAPSLKKLVTLAVEAEEGVSKCNMSKTEIVSAIVDTLMEKREMLEEYFSLTISKEGLVQKLPLVLSGYTPNLDKLPLFLMRLGPQVNWRSEADCFKTFLRELAYFYVPEPLFVEDSSASESSAEEDPAQKAVKWQIQHVIFPAMGRYFVAPKNLLDRDVVQVAHLPDLYRVFERC